MIKVFTVIYGLHYLVEAGVVLVGLYHVRRSMKGKDTYITLEARAPQGRRAVHSHMFPPRGKDYVS